MEYTQSDFNEGQKKINGQLCRADWKIIKAMSLFYELLDEFRPKVCEEKLAALKAAIDEANSVSQKVAEITPPGCEPSFRQDPGEEGYPTTTSATAGQTPTS